MITSLLLLYFTVFVFFQWGQRIAMTRINTKVFLITMLIIWLIIKNEF